MIHDRRTETWQTTATAHWVCMWSDELNSYRTSTLKEWISTGQRDHSDQHGLIGESQAIVEARRPLSQCCHSNCRPLLSCKVPQSVSSFFGLAYLLSLPSAQTMSLCSNTAIQCEVPGYLAAQLTCSSIHKAAGIALPVCTAILLHHRLYGQRITRPHNPIQKGKNGLHGWHNFFKQAIENWDKTWSRHNVSEDKAACISGFLTKEPCMHISLF